MEWIEGLNKAVDYIEEHLMEDIDNEKIAQSAGCPGYYFQKLFWHMSGMTLLEYIRKRRMSLAAVELQSSKIKVMDVALKYGYESPTAFNRAFQKIYKMAPSMVRKEKVLLKFFPPLWFHFSVHGKVILQYEIVKKEAFRILGISCSLEKELDQNFARIPKKWERALEEGILFELLELGEGTPSGLLGVSVHHTEEWKYYIAVTSKKEKTNFEALEIPEATWAVFSGRGTNVSLQELERRVIMEWLPTSGYCYDDVPDIEVYSKADPKDAVYEYWLPVKREGK